MKCDAHPDKSAQLKDGSCWWCWLDSFSARSKPVVLQEVAAIDDRIKVPGVRLRGKESERLRFLRAVRYYARRQGKTYPEMYHGLITAMRQASER